MKTVISKRTIARIVSFSLAIIAVLAAADIMYMRSLSKAEGFIEYGYRRAVEDLASGADSISTTLTKGLYSSSPAMMSRLSTELLSDSKAAKEALNKLPVSRTDLEKTEKFFSQIGNYAYFLSEKAASGGKVSYDDHKRMTELCEKAKELSESLWELSARFLSNDKSISELFSDFEKGSDTFITESFSGIEEGLSNAPKLIYDGPFSDHIMEKTPKMTKGAPSVSRDEAARKAALYCGVQDWELRDCDMGEEGKMPSYCFFAEGVNCAVTKNGGLVSYMIKSREPRSQKLSPSEAAVYAKAYLDSMALINMEMTYFETYNNVCTINFAYNDSGVTCYTDLIKVSVALDDGEILGFDARGFIVNHHIRDLSEPILSAAECQEKISPLLSVVKSSLAVIPSDSVEEKLCHEFKCTTDDGGTVLVYVNTTTGEEEDILILLETEDSTLTV